MIDLRLLKQQYTKDGVITNNLNGYVLRSEVFDSLNDNGSESNSKDSHFDHNDFFIKGYNSIVTDEDSNFYNVYNRDSIHLGMTAVELAYLLAHSEKCNFASDYDIVNDITKLRKYEDAIEMSIDLESHNSLDHLLPKGDIEGYLEDLKEGRVALSVQLAVLVMYLNESSDSQFTNGLLAPLRRVSRFEVSTILGKIMSF